MSTALALRATRPPGRERNALRCRAVGLLVTLLLCATSSRVSADVGVGSYCPLPEKGQKPKCLSGAEQRYADFYRGLEAGAVDPSDAARVEEDLVAGGEAQRTYQALSSIAYGYYVLARRAAQSPTADPLLVARLERWNSVLAQAYHDTPPDASLRVAVRDAAEDLRRRAAPVEVGCKDESGRLQRCTSTEAVLRSMDDARDRKGLRGQIGRLIERLFGANGS
ncbi:MAG: hypothetical protein IT386_05425 [Deltaproteobacteria bacterium]|nr:hypothetical protein [Deltaproteobacteria bacterium]